MSLQQGCPIYEVLRNTLFTKVENEMPYYDALSNFEKMCILPSNCNIIR